MRSRLSRIGFIFFSTNLLLVGNLVVSSPANSATAITIFDGTYEGYEVLTVTITIPTNPPTKKTITSTTPTFSFTVVNGKIAGGVYGFIINNSGTGALTVPIPGYGSITLTSHFVRNATTRAVSVTGTISGSFPSAGVVVGGKFYAHLADKFKFNIPSSIPGANIGKRYSGYSFCTPKVPAGYGCGWPSKSTSPTGGKPPYTFRLKVGSFTGGGDLLPTGLVLNFKNGQITGTPRKGLKTRTFRLVVCAYDANDSWNGVCRATNLVLGP